MFSTLVVYIVVEGLATVIRQEKEAIQIGIKKVKLFYKK